MVGLQVDLGRIDAFMTEPERDDGGIDASVQQLHGRGVAQQVWCDFLVASDGHPAAAMAVCCYANIHMPLEPDSPLKSA